MKKQLIICALILFAGMVTNSYSQKKDGPLKKGLSTNLFIGIPSGYYGLPRDLGPVPAEFQFGFLGGLQIGNRWYIKPTKQYGVGIFVNWADISVAYKAGTAIDPTRVVGDVTLLAFGPIGTYAISRDMAVDAYYNIRPTALVSLMYDPNDQENGTAYLGVRPTHAFGAAFRWKVLSVGLEYVLGNILCTNLDTHLVQPDEIKVVANNFRVRLGVKF